MSTAPSGVATCEVSDVKAAGMPERSIPRNRTVKRGIPRTDSKQRRRFETCNKHYVRPADSKRSTVVSQRITVLRVAESECRRQSESEIVTAELHCALHSGGSESVKYCVRDRRQCCEHQQTMELSKL